MDGIAAGASESRISGPPSFDGFDHASFPCRDPEEGIRFYRDVLGGRLVVMEDAFAMFDICGAHVGIGLVGCTFIEPGNEYPRIGLTCSAGALVRMKEWLSACGIPSSNFWTRAGIEALMFFRDPSGNITELYCHEGFEGADRLPRGPVRGHGMAVDIHAITNSDWCLPAD